MPIGCKVTLRGDRMWEFLDRLIVDRAAARPRLPRRLARQLRRPRQLHASACASRCIFPEIDYDKIDNARGLDVTITTTAPTDDEARELLRALGMPFRES